MTSLRHMPLDPRDAYLDAARDCLLDLGWRRTTLTEVARRAGVSRMTIYRSWSDMGQLLGDLMTREWGTVATSVHDRLRAVPVAGPGTGRAGGADPVGQLRDDLVALVHALRRNELFVRIVEVDPELVLPYLLSRRGRSQDDLLGTLSRIIEAGQAAGVVRAGPPGLLARTLVLAGHGFVLSAQTMVDDLVTEADLDRELGRLIERVLT